MEKNEYSGIVVNTTWRGLQKEIDIDAIKSIEDVKSFLKVVFYATSKPILISEEFAKEVNFPEHLMKDIDES